ncbi:MAG TPA: PEP-CTERM sorting domain-containing protein [Acidobacteriaceae bacterium]|jgi:hypothetical protein
MKIFRFVVVAALMLGLSGICQATVIHVLDPSKSEKASPNIYNLDTPIDFSFYTCPSFVTNGSTDPMGCYSAVNYTGSVITGLSATITAKTAIPGGLSCPTDYPDGAYTLGNGFDAATCSISGDDTMIFDFTGGHIAPGGAIWIIEDGMDAKDFKKDAGTFVLASTPEPSSLLLALTGMGPFGYVVRRRFRKSKA